LDAQGNIVVAGYFGGIVDFDPSPSNAYLSSSINGNSVFLAKYDLNGNFIWVKGLIGNAIAQASSVKTDSNGDCYLTGGFQGTVDFDASAATFNLSSNGSYDFFIAKYSSSGGFIWAEGFGGVNLERAYALSLDANNNILVTGVFRSTVDFDFSLNTYTISALTSTSDIFIAKYSNSGNFLWAKGIQSDDSKIVASLACDTNNNIFITGNFQDTCNFDPTSLNAKIISNGLDDIFLAKYDSLGNFLWVKGIGGSQIDAGTTIDIISGNLYLGGSFRDIVDFDPSLSTYTLSSFNSGQDFFISLYDLNGNFSWAKGIGQNSGEALYDLAVNTTGEILTAGAFAMTCDFDPSPSIYTITSTYSTSLFVAKYDNTGNFIWAKSTNKVAGGVDISYSVKIDDSGNSYITGFLMAQWILTLRHQRLY
jgi:uncharacterized protein (DUF2249 family)/phosphoribosyl-AMP cyclohydrolase